MMVKSDFLVSYQTHPKRITKMDRKMVNDLDYDDIKFLVSTKDMIQLKRIIASGLIWWVIKVV